MDYRMYSGGAQAGENVVDLIKEQLAKQRIKTNGTLKMVGFEGDVGTEFFLNGHAESMKIPSSKKFYTPYNGPYFMPIYKLIFKEDFSGDIYYII